MPGMLTQFSWGPRAQSLSEGVSEVSAGTSIISSPEDREFSSKPLHVAVARPQVLTGCGTENQFLAPATHGQAAQAPQSKWWVREGARDRRPSVYATFWGGDSPPQGPSLLSRSELLGPATHKVRLHGSVNTRRWGPLGVLSSHRRLSTLRFTEYRVAGPHSTCSFPVGFFYLHNYFKLHPCCCVYH